MSNDLLKYAIKTYKLSQNRNNVVISLNFGPHNTSSTFELLKGQ